MSYFLTKYTSTLRLYSLLGAEVLARTYLSSVKVCSITWYSPTSHGDSPFRKNCCRSIYRNWATSTGWLENGTWDISVLTTLLSIVGSIPTTDTGADTRIITTTQPKTAWVSTPTPKLRIVRCMGNSVFWRMHNNILLTVIGHVPDQIEELRANMLPNLGYLKSQRKEEMIDNCGIIVGWRLQTVRRASTALSSSACNDE